MPSGAGCAAGGLIEGLLALPWAVPGTVFAIALATAFSVRAPWAGRFVLVGTLWILPLAYLVRNLPITSRAMLAGVPGPRSLAGRGGGLAGRRRWRTLRRVTLPLLRPALLAGASLAFVTAFGDFVTSIMLYTYDTRPISLEILSSLRAVRRRRGGGLRRRADAGERGGLRRSGARPGRRPDDATAERQPSQFRRLAVLIAVNFVDMIGFMIVLPLLPFYALKLHATPETIGRLIASFSIAQLLAAPLWGRVSDRYGRRPALLIGLSASAVAYVVFGLADAVWLLFLSRLVQGAGGGTTGVAQAYVADTVEPKRPGPGARLALGGHLCRRHAWARASARSPLTWATRRRAWSRPALCLINVLFAWQLAARIASRPATRRQRARGGPIWHPAWLVLRHPDHLVSPADLDLRRRDARLLRHDLGAGAVSAARVRARREDHRVRSSPTSACSRW